MREENKNLRDDMVKMHDRIKESERVMKLTNDEIEMSLREKHREYQEELHKLRNQIEVANFKEKDVQVKADKLEDRNIKLNEELGKDRRRVLDLEKENQILIEQVVSMKEHLKSHGAKIDEEVRREAVQAEEFDGARNSGPQQSDDHDSYPLQSNMLDSKFFPRLSKFIRSQEMALSNKKPRSNKNSKYSGIHGSMDEAELERENKDLRDVISQMKEEMENAQQHVETAFKVNSFKRGY